VSIVPIKTIVTCDKCGYDWVEHRNTLDTVEKKCPKCDNKVSIF